MVSSAASPDDEGEVVEITAEELDRLANEMLGSDDSESDDDNELAEAVEEEEESEVAAPDFPDRDPAETILTAKRKNVAIFVRASVAHIVGQDLSKSAQLANFVRYSPALC